MERRRFLFSVAGSIAARASVACRTAVQTVWEQETRIGRAITVLPGGKGHPESGTLVLQFDTDRLPSGLEVVEARIVTPVPFSVSVRRALNGQGLPNLNYFDIVSVLTLDQEDREIPPARLLLDRVNQPGFNAFFVAWKNNQHFNSTGATLLNLVTPTPGR